MSSSGHHEEKSKKARIFLVDDHEVVRFGIGQLINRQKDMMVCGSAANANAALGAIGELQPDLITVDLALEDSDGLELIKNLRAQYPKLLVLVVTMHDEGLYGELAIHAGAMGYINKDVPLEDILGAIRKVLGGGVYLSENLSAAMLMQQVGRQTQAAISPIARLSKRELQVFQLIGQWKGTRSIAQELHLSVKTVEYYREQIKQKLNLKNASHLLQAARIWVESGHAS